MLPFRELDDALDQQRDRGGSDATRHRRERAPDPDSPFAKLAALKAQLESGGNGKR